MALRLSPTMIKKKTPTISCVKSVTHALPLQLLYSMSTMGRDKWGVIMVTFLFLLYSPSVVSASTCSSGAWNLAVFVQEKKDMLSPNFWRNLEARILRMGTKLDKTLKQSIPSQRSCDSTHQTFWESVQEFYAISTFIRDRAAVAALYFMQGP